MAASGVLLLSAAVSVRRGNGVGRTELVAYSAARLLSVALMCGVNVALNSDFDDSDCASDRLPPGSRRSESSAQRNFIVKDKEVATVAGKIGDAEEGNLAVRLIALENIIVALLADAPEGKSERVREMADFITPRPGKTPHRLTIEAARNMLALVERAAHYRSQSA